MADVLTYKLELLKLEIETINRAILDRDQTFRQIKHWAITLWLGAAAFAGTKHIEEPNLPTTLWAASTIVIPLAFLILDLTNKRTQRKFIWRARKIHRFVNDIEHSLTQAFERGDVTDFRVFDPGGENWRREKSEEESRYFEDFINPFKLLKNPSMWVVYGCLVVCTLALVILPWIEKGLSTIVVHVGS